jgi:cytosine/uracil/thiamine/allantoin permease
LIVEWVRYGNIGIAVGAAITVIGVLVFRDSSEAAMQAVAMIGWFTGLAVALLLDGRARRRKNDQLQ